MPLSFAMIIIGISILVFLAVDLIWTTVIPHGAGPLTRMMARAVSRYTRTSRTGLRRLTQRFGGSACLLLTLFCWVALVWTGWALVFIGLPGGVVNSTTGQPAGTIDRVYFAGYTIFTLGLGDFKPEGWIAQLLTPIATFWGLFIITLSITYIIPVLSAVNEQRQLTAMIRDLGETPANQVIMAWDGEQITRYFQRINQMIVPQLHLHNQRHRTYPVIHNFRSDCREESFAVMLAVLSESIDMIDLAISTDDHCDPWHINPSRRAIEALLTQTDGAFTGYQAPVPPVGSIAALADAHLPTRESQVYEQKIQSHSDRRQRLASFVADAGWDWAIVEFESHTK